MSAEETIRALIKKAIEEEPISKPFEDNVVATTYCLITTPSDIKENAKVLCQIRTGTFIDDVFLDDSDRIIHGLPFGSNSLITGLPNSGKSILLEEIALKMAENLKVCLVTSEEVWSTDTLRYDLENRMKKKALDLKLSWNKIRENLRVLDVVSNSKLGEWYNFVSSYRKLVEQDGIQVLLVDSLTMLEDSRGQLKYRLSELSKYNQKHGVTAVFINQRSSEDADGLSMAGGIALSHIVDVVMIMDYKKVWTGDAQLKVDTGIKQGETVNFFRVLKCRMCKFDAHYFAYKITNNGLVELLPKPETEKV